MRDLHKHVANNFNYAQLWKELGIILNLDPSQLNEIQRKSPHDNSRQYCIEMFQLWMKRTPDCSWDQIISAINELTAVSEIGYTGMNLLYT